MSRNTFITIDREISRVRNFKYAKAFHAVSFARVCDFRCVLAELIMTLDALVRLLTTFENRYGIPFQSEFD